MSRYKLRKCPKCGSNNVAEILYGMPNFSDYKLQQDLNAGRIVCGGCCISEDNPEYRCNDCGCEFSK